MAQSTSTISDYKALICIFLNGGNDSNNLFIPTIASEYANYAAIRTPVLAIPNTDGSGATALALNNLTNDGHAYGIHPACPELQTLFNAGKLATVFNVGTLVYPVTKAQYTANSVALPPQLFSARGPAGAMANVDPRPPAPAPGWGRALRGFARHVQPEGQRQRPALHVHFGGGVQHVRGWRHDAAVFRVEQRRRGADDQSLGPPPPRRPRARPCSTTCSASTRCSRTCSRKTTRSPSSTRWPAARA